MNLTVTRGATHEYVDQETGRPYFSWSQVAKVLDPDAFAGVSKDVMDRATERGRRLHFLFAFALAARAGKGPALEPFEDVTIRPYAESMLRFLEDYNVLPVCVEERSCNPGIGYAGTPDAIVLMDGLEVLVDLKSGGPRRIHRVQLQVYRKLERYKHLRHMRGVYLKPDGTGAQVVEVRENPADWAWFLSGLGVLQGRLNP